MNRLLLTLLALLTGLAAQASPAAATARSGGETEIERSETQLARHVEAAAAVAIALAGQVQPLVAAPPSALPSQLALPTRAVLIGIDRARE